ncbi:hypothetical protein CVD28_02325 [Bacillus sp. M6-12]|uniref:helix-turn-helix domain-containing protein n=1 Tax=Bacillus sp. M6-12 TaxID=2054166 RepID=UPI000C790475|nr:helix-turn-helix transcriptional regulator [Bacillus sp. M6-12]PLS19269.1 hypothetical protein CVD28_02325 [Bacillus sp. M6-12]
MLKVVKLRETKPEITHNQFKEQLKKQRMLQHMKQEELAERAGLTRREISEYELGKEIPDVLNLKKLAIALRVSMDYLWGESNVGTEQEPIMIHLEDIVSGDSPYGLQLDGFMITPKELQEAIDYIAFKRFRKPHRQ